MYCTSSYVVKRKRRRRRRRRREGVVVHEWTSDVTEKTVPSNTYAGDRVCFKSRLG